DRERGRRSRVCRRGLCCTNYLADVAVHPRRQAQPKAPSRRTSPSLRPPRCDTDAATQPRRSPPLVSLSLLAKNSNTRTECEQSERVSTVMGWQRRHGEVARCGRATSPCRRAASPHHRAFSRRQRANSQRGRAISPCGRAISRPRRAKARPRRAVSRRERGAVLSVPLALTKNEDSIQMSPHSLLSALAWHLLRRAGRRRRRFVGIAAGCGLGGLRRREF